MAKSVYVVLEWIDYEEAEIWPRGFVELDAGARAAIEDAVASRFHPRSEKLREKLRLKLQDSWLVGSEMQHPDEHEVAQLMYGDRGMHPSNRVHLRVHRIQLTQELTQDPEG